jgi:hypothetical protein
MLRKSLMSGAVTVALVLGTGSVRAEEPKSGTKDTATQATAELGQFRIGTTGVPSQDASDKELTRGGGGRGGHGGHGGHGGYRGGHGGYRGGHHGYHGRSYGHSRGGYRGYYGHNRGYRGYYRPYYYYSYSQPYYYYDYSEPTYDYDPTYYYYYYTQSASIGGSSKNAEPRKSAERTEAQMTVPASLLKGTGRK